MLHPERKVRARVMAYYGKSLSQFLNDAAESADSRLFRFVLERMARDREVLVPFVYHAIEAARRKPTFVFYHILVYLRRVARTDSSLFLSLYTVLNGCNAQKIMGLAQGHTLSGDGEMPKDNIPAGLSRSVARAMSRIIHGTTRRFSQMVRDVSAPLPKRVELAGSTPVVGPMSRERVDHPTQIVSFTSASERAILHHQRMNDPIRLQRDLERIVGSAIIVVSHPSGIDTKPATNKMVDSVLSPLIPYNPGVRSFIAISQPKRDPETERLKATIADLELRRKCDETKLLELECAYTDLILEVEALRAQLLDVSQVSSSAANRKSGSSDDGSKG